MEYNWRNVFEVIIILVVAAAGAPFTQMVKLLLTKLFHKVIEDRWALVVTGIVAAIFAILETWLAGLLNFSLITRDNFPATFFMVFSVATVYFAWLKNSDSIFGKKLLLKPPE